MIRIYADESDCVELMVRNAGVEICPAIRVGAADPQHPRARRRSIGMTTAALLVLVSASGGYLLAQRVPAGRAAVLAAAAPSRMAPPHPWPVPGPAPANPSGAPSDAPSEAPSEAMKDALAQSPSVTPAPAAPKSGTPAGVAAFGLQP